MARHKLRFENGAICSTVAALVTGLKNRSNELRCGERGLEGPDRTGALVAPVCPRPSASP